MHDIIEKIQNRTLAMDLSECNWGEGVALWGFNHSVEHFPNERYVEELKKWVTNGLTDGKFKFTVNTSIPYVGMGEVYKATGNKEYLTLMKKQADYLVDEAPRLKNGAIIHTDPYAKFGRQMWADTVFMAGLFLAYMGKLTGEKRYIDEALTQLKIHIEVLQDKDGLFYHGWDETENDFIGCKWGRANAWVAVAITEMLDYIPEVPELTDALKRLLEAIRPWQNEDGVWRTVIDGSFSYFEYSSAYGFGYAILKGIRMGILDESYLDIWEKMKDTLIANVDGDGKVNNISAGTPVMRNEAEYNIICEHRIQTWGQGLAMMYFGEYWTYIKENQKKSEFNRGCRIAVAQV